MDLPGRAGPDFCPLASPFRSLWGGSLLDSSGSLLDSSEMSCDL